MQRKSPKNANKSHRVRCICPNEKVCPSKNRDVSLLRLIVEQLESLLSSSTLESDRAFIRNLIKRKN